MTSSHSMKMQGGSQYYPLMTMIAVSFIYMYFFMYAMIDGVPHFYNNVNQIYMAGLMAAPMAIVELFVMRSMYNDRRINVIVVIISAIALLHFGSLFENRLL